MIFDRKPFYLIASGVALVVLAVVFFAVPRLAPEQRVREQLTILSREPWTKISIERVVSAGAGQTVLEGVRLDRNTPVRVQFIDKSPYTAESAMKYLADHELDGATADVLMLPRSIAVEPFRSQFAPSTTHVGVAVFAGLAESGPSDAIPAAASGDMTIESPTAPPETPAAKPATHAEPHG